MFTNDLYDKKIKIIDIDDKVHVGTVAYITPKGDDDEVNRDSITIKINGNYVCIYDFEIKKIEVLQ
ncbi:hypothetical protein SAMN05421767_10369 [Granulicatella balaenopterae]|uniref:Uncharacterized protein n=1 Tax=Granulicatella balaenopterae TaxID=137733 RepID=A0A1H9HUI5_9LACT|nr:hypothetical protein [Granulicatella balaenopterae]SEQ66019.1 hypothetical protein SAMN05421767_10369 [Granulicatella balaenopterae]